jgi:hypothetical protein
MFLVSFKQKEKEPKQLLTSTSQTQRTTIDYVTARLPQNLEEDSQWKSASGPILNFK